MTLTVETVMSALALIVAIGASAKVLYGAKKWLESPLEEIRKRMDEHDKYLENDQKRLEEISKSLESLTEAINILIKSHQTVLDHLEEGNHTGEIREEKKHLNDWLVDSRSK